MKEKMGYHLEIGKVRGNEVEGNAKFSRRKKNDSGMRNLYTEQF